MWWKMVVPYAHSTEKMVHKMVPGTSLCREHKGTTEVARLHDNGMLHTVGRRHGRCGSIWHRYTATREGGHHSEYTRRWLAVGAGRRYVYVARRAEKGGGKQRCGVREAVARVLRQAPMQAGGRVGVRVRRQGMYNVKLCMWYKWSNLSCPRVEAEHQAPAVLRRRRQQTLSHGVSRSRCHVVMQRCKDG